MDKTNLKLQSEKEMSQLVGRRSMDFWHKIRVKMYMKRFIIWLVMSLAMGSLFSCSDNIEMGLFPVQEDGTSFVLTGNKVQLFYPSAKGRIEFLVTGLEADYIISTSDETVLSVGYASNGLYLVPLKLGKVVVTISDKAGREFKFDVENVYWKEEYIVEKNDIRIGGEILTEKEKEEITYKAKSIPPVEIGGGYQFIYTDEERTEGIVNMYPEGWDKRYFSGNFTEKHFAGRNGIVYNLVFDDSQIEFSFWQDESYFYFEQSLLPQFLDKYPDILYVDLKQTMLRKKS